MEKNWRSITRIQKVRELLFSWNPGLSKRPGSAIIVSSWRWPKQKTTATGKGKTRRHATFNWDAKITVKLDFVDICEFLMVLEGKVEQAGGRKGRTVSCNGGDQHNYRLQEEQRTGRLLPRAFKERYKRFSGFQGAYSAQRGGRHGLRAVFQGGLFPLMFHGQMAFCR